ncbi:hypothetical protein INT44_008067 [Umbelopsis vinacea]|uniref:Uncharacterized protein n=1 Tax=Umbelopsis vinacea TaxID=44442 RepID=A0A8H7PPR1_9FUNG|nr:hypothetical protein INT44_008067 [Umbelopsis vinacea]KAI9285467.1 hypothetical protein BC943DRAFT_352193 [Umbelopsis sp. AD052]
MSQLGTIRRRVQTIFFDIGRARNIWDELNSDGFTLANALVNAKIQQQYAEDTSYWHPALTHAIKDIRVSYERKMEASIMDINESLSKITTKMNTQLVKMENLVNQLKDTYKRLVDLQGKQFADTSPLYATCPMLNFVERASDVLIMYQSEYKTKMSLVSGDGLRNCKNNDEGLVLLSAWLNQPSLRTKDLEDLDELCDIEMAIME